jgi:hypothetical protein
VIEADRRDRRRARHARRDRVQAPPTPSPARRSRRRPPPSPGTPARSRPRSRSAAPPVATTSASSAASDRRRPRARDADALGEPRQSAATCRGPVRSPAVRSTASVIAAVDPLPLVPAICTARNRRCGLPSLSSASRMRPSPRSTPSARTPARRASTSAYAIVRPLGARAGAAGG